MYWEIWLRMAQIDWTETQPENLILMIILSYLQLTGFYLSPLGVIHTCSSDQVSLNCVTNGMFLEWNITTGPNYSRQRLISSSETRDIPSLSVNHTTFIFVRQSRYPLNITLFVINATVNWQISCTEYSSSDQNTLETTISIIEVIHINSKFNLFVRSRIMWHRS